VSRAALATSVTVVIPGVPPNWANARFGHHMARHKAMAGRDSWKERAHMLAHSARNEAHWPLPVKTDPPARRYLTAAIFKRLPLYDDDGAVSCLKPLIDGTQGALIVGDSSAWCALVTPPSELQHAVAREDEECVTLTVHLVDPR
jgi:hypothetical protein